MYMNKLLSVILAALFASAFSVGAIAAMHTTAAPVMPGDKSKDMKETMKDHAKEKAKTEVKKEVMKEGNKSGK